MANLKLFLLLTNLVIIRLSLASVAGQEDHPTTTTTTTTNNNNHNQDQSSMSILDNINSLDFAPNEQTFEQLTEKQQTIQESSNEKNITSNRKGKTLVVVDDDESSERKLANSIKPKSKQNGSSSRSIDNGINNNNNIGNLLINLLGQLEKVDIKRMITDSFAASNELSDVKRKNNKKRSNSTNPSNHVHNTNNSTNNKRTDNNNKERISLGAISNESGNLLSITKQLVKLARSGVIGGEFNSAPFLTNWVPSPPTMFSAASHMFHNDQNDFTGATLKSEWFWLVAPAVIVIGAGVIVIPLIAAWLVSHMMQQNSFTVSAGRRRRRRDLTNQHQEIYKPTGIHDDLIKMLDIHRLLYSPELLVDNLSKFHGALDSVFTNLIEPINNSKILSKQQQKY